MKKVILSMLSLTFLLTSCGDTQKQDKKNEEQKLEQAANSAEDAVREDELSDKDATTVAVDVLQANIDNAMSKVALPKFKKENATILAREFHKDLSELVNADSAKKANKYLDKLASLKKDYDKKVLKAKLDPSDKISLDKYVDNLIIAVEEAN